MTRMTQALDRMIVVVDVVGFTAPGRHLRDRLAVRDGMYEVVEKALTESGVDYDSCVREDRGDGALLLLPPGASRSVVIDKLPERLVVELLRYNSTHTPQAQFKLRVSLNSGEVMHDGRGWVGEAVDTAFRILDEKKVKDAFAESGRLVAFISSQRLYHDVIAPDPGLLPESYRRVRVVVKTFSGTAYLRLHGESANPVPQIPAQPTRRSSPRRRSAEQAAVDVHRVDEALLDLIPGGDLGMLRARLAGLKVPRLRAMVARALGPAVPLPRMDGVADAWAAFELLTDFNAGPDGVPPAIAFLQLLTQQPDDYPDAAVHGWLDEQARSLRLGPALEARQQAQPRPLPERPLLHLTIMLEPVAADPARCTLAVWRQDDPEVWPPALADIREIEIAEAEHRVDEVIVETERFWAGQSVSASVEFVLPRSLINLPVQRWCKEHASGDPQPLRYGYRLGIRSLERMRAMHWHRPWLLRWDSMLADPSADRLHYSGEANTGGHPIDAVLSDERWVGLVMAKPPSPQAKPGAGPDELTSALRGGLPVILWHPEAGPEKLRELLDWLLCTDGGFAELPERRKLANSRSDVPFENALAHDLVVMWDDPKRVIVLDQPLIPVQG